MNDNRYEKIEKDIEIKKKLLEKTIWNMKDLKTYLEISVSTIYRWKNKKVEPLPSRRRGSKLFFIPQEVLNWIEEGLELE